MYSYKPLEAGLRSKGLSKSDLSSKLGISSRTIAKIAKVEKISDRVLFLTTTFCRSSGTKRTRKQRAVFITKRRFG